MGGRGESYNQKDGGLKDGAVVLGAVGGSISKVPKPWLWILLQISNHFRAFLHSEPSCRTQVSELLIPSFCVGKPLGMWFMPPSANDSPSEGDSTWGEMPNSWVKHESPRLQRLNWVYCVTEVSGQTCEEMVPQSPLSEEQITEEGEWT